MNEQAIIQEFQAQVAAGKPAAQVAQQLAGLYPQFAQKLQALAGGQPGQPAQGAVTQPPASVASTPVQAGAAAAQAQKPANPLGPGNPPTYWKDPGERTNTNAPGVQSNGDDDPWLIGAGIGTTYSPEVMYRWYQKAKAGDGKAAYVLRQVGFFDEQNRPKFTGDNGLADWAASRHLDRKADAGAKSPWYHDPGNYGQEGFANEQDAIAAHTAQPWAQVAGGENDGPATWRKPSAAPAATLAAPVNPQSDQGMQRQEGDDWGMTQRGGAPAMYPQEEKPDGTVGHSTTPMPIEKVKPGADPSLDDYAAQLKKRNPLDDDPIPWRY